MYISFPAGILPPDFAMISRGAVFSWAWHRRASLLMLFLGILAPLVLIGKLAEDVLENDPLSFDYPIQMWARSWHSEQANRVMLTLSAFGSPPMMLALCGAVACVLVWLHRRGDALFFFLAAFGAAALNLGAKLVFGRARPDLWVSINPPTDYSFPSGHAMGTMAVFAALTMIVWPSRARWPFAVAAVLLVLAVGLSRVYLGVHFPSDVLCGWCASLAWVVGLERIRHWRRKYSTRLDSRDD